MNINYFVLYVRDIHDTIKLITNLHAVMTSNTLLNE